jgi:hypothetical protein
MCTAAFRIGGKQGLHDLLDMSADGEISLAWVQVQSASWHAFSDLLREVRGHEYIVFSMVEPHVDPDFIEPERLLLYLAQVVVDPTRRTPTPPSWNISIKSARTSGCSSIWRSTSESSTENSAKLPSGSSRRA